MLPVVTVYLELSVLTSATPHRTYAAQLRCATPICSNMWTLSKAVDRSIEGPSLSKAVTALLRVPVVPSDFDLLISGYRLI